MKLLNMVMLGILVLSITSWKNNPANVSSSAEAATKTNTNRIKELNENYRFMGYVDGRKYCKYGGINCWDHAIGNKDITGVTELNEQGTELLIQYKQGNADILVIEGNE